MGNEEYKGIMDELFKFLRDKISLSLGTYLSDKQKEKLYSFELDNIIVGKQSNKIIEYSHTDNKIYISDEFLTPEYVNKIKEKNPDFDLIDLKNRVNEENPRILLEEFIVFSDELKISEKDLIKSLFIQEILKMILLNDEMDAKEDAIMTGVIELLAHTIGNQNGFLVGTPKKYLDELDVAISLKNEFEDKFESIVLGENVLDYLSRIENRRLLQKIDELADNRKIIESTQNLDNVIDSIVNMTKENEEIVKENTIEDNNLLEKEEVEEIIEIDAPKEEIVEEVKPETKEETVPKDIEVSNNVLEEKTPKRNKELVLALIGTLLIVILGIIVGYLLFKSK